MADFLTTICEHCKREIGYAIVLHQGRKLGPYWNTPDDVIFGVCDSAGGTRNHKPGWDLPNSMSATDLREWLAT